MKKILLFLSLLFSASWLCVAQQPQGTFQIGLVAGLTHTFYRAEEKYEDYKSDFRGAAGFSFRYQLKHVFLKANLLYENKGMKFKTYDFSSIYPHYVIDYYYQEKNNTARRHLHFITLPILVGTHIKQTGFFVNAGPYVGWLLRTGYSYEKGESRSFKPDDRLDFGLMAGLGYARPISARLEISGELRHSYGLYNVDGYKPNEEYVNSTSLLLGIHYNFTGN